MITLFNKRKKDDMFSGMDTAEGRKMLCLGVKMHMVQRALESGIQNCSYEGILSFDAVPLHMQKGYVCDGVAVALPAKPQDLCRALDGHGAFSSGLFVHLGVGGRHMAWAHIDNLTDDDIVAIGRVVDAAPSFIPSMKR